MVRVPVEENAEKCAPIVAKCHALGVSVEVEEGEIGAAGALADPNIDANIESYYTKTEDARKLCELTRPDALAIFVGNGHGKYLKEPRIGFDRIREIADSVADLGVYVVLHGGSGLSPETFNRAIEAGAAKVNYATTVSDIWFEYFPEELLAEIDAKAKEMGKPRRKVLDLFQDKIDAIPADKMQEAIDDMSGHIKMMMTEGFKSAGKANL